METSTILTFLLFAVLHNPVVSNKTCRVTDDSVEKHQKMFQQLVSEKKSDMIYIYLKAPEIYEIRDDEFDENRMAEWIWVTAEYQHFLRYPLDFDLYTFGVLRRGIKTLHLQIDVDNVLVCKHSSHTDFLYDYLTKVVNGTESGMICHRYFDDQQWKSFFFNISHVSIGYDFECFPNKEGVNKREIITKSPIIYLTIIIVVLLISFYPAIVSITIQEEKEDQQLMVYTKADNPYTFQRFLFYILFRKTSRTFISLFRLTFLIALFGCVFYSIKIIITAFCNHCIPTDIRQYPRVFDLSTGELEDAVGVVIFNSIFFLVCLFALSCITLNYKKMKDHIILLDITNVCFYPLTTSRFLYLGSLKLLPVECFVKPSNHGKSVFSQTVVRYKMIGSIYFWSKLFLFPMRNFTEIRKLSYQLLYVFFSSLISIINITVFLFCTLSPLMNVMYHHSIYIITATHKLVLFPLKSFRRETIDFRYVNPVLRYMLLFLLVLSQVTACSIPITGSIAMYLLFVNNYVTYGWLYFLQTLIYSIFAALPHLYFTQIHTFSAIFVGITYILYFIASFHKKYRTILLYLLKLKNTSKMNVEEFEKVVSRFFPLRNAVFALLAKSLFTVLFLAIIFITFQDVHLLDKKSDIDFNILFPIIASLFAPGIIEKYCFESIEDKLHRKENAINELLTGANDIENVVSNEEADIQFCNCYGITDESERILNQVKFERKYAFPCIRCEKHEKSTCQVFCEELCACFTLKCVNNETTHANHCTCCYTLVENYQSADYELLSGDDRDIHDNQNEND